jgi:signal transduction histidine kinase/ActR/RegA family two-component response regulator
LRRKKADVTSAPTIEALKTTRVLICAPVRRDIELLSRLLETAGLRSDDCPDPSTLGQRLRNDALALLITEEALVPELVQVVRSFIDDQPFWSDFPIIVFTGPATEGRYLERLNEFGPRANVTLVDRPVRMKSVVSIMQSVARARTRQFEIRDLLAKLEDRIAERDRFLAILGHELRNPLSAILLAAQMTGSDGKLDGEHAALIERQSRHLTRLVNDLLDLSRVVSGKIVLKKQTVDLRQIVHQCLQTLRDSDAARNVSIELQDHVSSLPTMADPVRAEQIVSNILTNAVKYTPEGGHIVVALDRDDTNAIICVSDNGVGIAPERIGTIFELFAQAENAIGRSQGGMGIGLALVRNLVELHGGSIAAKSDGIGHGSEFTVRLPLATAAEASASEMPRQTATPTPPGIERRIVIVEDNADIRELLRLKLRKLGHVVGAASDGPEGVRQIVDMKPDLALIDIGLPGFDGYEVASKVRGELGDSVVLVAVSGFGQPEDKRKAHEAGFDLHMTKPADVHDIEEMLARFPPRNSARRGSVLG